MVALVKVVTCVGTDDDASPSFPASMSRTVSIANVEYVVNLWTGMGVIVTTARRRSDASVGWVARSAAAVDLYFHFHFCGTASQEDKYRTMHVGMRRGGARSQFRTCQRQRAAAGEQALQSGTQGARRWCPAGFFLFYFLEFLCAHRWSTRNQRLPGTQSLGGPNITKQKPARPTRRKLRCRAPAAASAQAPPP